RRRHTRSLRDWSSDVCSSDLFLLNDVPMLDKGSVLNAHNICGNPIHRSTETAKSSVHDHELSLSHYCSGLVLERWREAFDEIERSEERRVGKECTDMICRHRQ